MKHYHLVFALFVMASCGKADKEQASIKDLVAGKNVELLKEAREKLQTKLAETNADISLVDEALSRLDQSFTSVLVEAMTVKDTLFKHYVEVQGNVKTKENVLLSSEYSGILKSLAHREGDWVEKGAVLATISDGGLKEHIQQTKINLNLSRTSYERQKRLWEQKIGSEMQYLQAEANYKAQENVLEQLRSQLEKTIIRAPFSGVIDAIASEEGNTVSPGTPILRLISLKHMEVEAEIPEKYIKNVKKGSEITVQFATTNEVYASKVRQASNYINPNNRCFRIELDIENPSDFVKPNLTATLKITDYVSPKAILIPESIIQENSKHENYVYVAKRLQGDLALAERVFITVGKRQNNAAEILENLHEGDIIITEGWKNLKDNQKIKLVYGK